MDSFSLKAIATELDSFLRGGTIERVTQPQNTMVLLEIKPPRLSSRASRDLFMSLPRPSPKKPFRLLVSVDHQLPRVHLTASDFENPKAAPSFCMLLRKHIVGGRIVNVVLRGIERVLHLVVEKRDPVGRIQRFTLIGEIMGRHSNLFFLESRTGIILDALKPVSPSKQSVRDLRRNAPYVSPPLQRKEDPLAIAEDRFTELSERARRRSKSKSISPRWLVDTFAGFGPNVASYIADGDKRGSLWNVFRDSRERFLEGRFLPGIITFAENDEGTLWVLPVPEGMKTSSYKSANAAADELYGRSWGKKRLKESQGILLKKTTAILKRRRKTIDQIKSEMARSEEADVHQRKGEILLMNLGSVARGVDSVRLRDVVSGNELEVLLDVKLNAQQNAEKYFSRAKKLRRSSIHGQRRLKQLEGEIKKFELLNLQVESADGLKSLAIAAAEIEKATLDKGKGEASGAGRVDSKSVSGRKGIEKPPSKKSSVVDPRSGKKADGNHTGPSATQPRAIGESSIRKGEGESKSPLEKSKRKELASKSGTTPSPKEPSTSNARKAEIIKKKSSYYRVFNMDGGWEILVGKNDRGNDYLLRQVAKGEDLWLHAQGVPGSHVVVRHGERGREVPQSVLEAAAQLAAYYSKGKGSGKQAVDYLPVKRLHRIKGGRSGQVTLRGQRTIIISPQIPSGLLEFDNPAP